MNTSASIDWKSIRVLNGSQSNGFEELCAQLARREIPDGWQFERNGPPDAGVECYATLPSGDEWGWQAKYFGVLGNSQWSQLDESIRTALEKHPHLTKYFVCVPLDRSDARVGKQRSAKQRWEEHKAKWRDWARSRAMDVKFVWWGSHELIERLLRTANAGLVRYWFDATVLDPGWLQARLEEAIQTAGPRYTPEARVELPIAQELQTFERTAESFNRLKAHAKSIRSKLQTFGYHRKETPDPKVEGLSSALEALVQKVLGQISALQVQPIGDLPLGTIVELLTSAGSSADELSKAVSEAESLYATEKVAQEPERATSALRNPYSDQRLRLYDLMSTLEAARKHFEHAAGVAGRSVMILRGRAGTGKTHLLCDVAIQRVNSGRPTILVMGQRFVGSDNPWTQFLQQLDLSVLSAEEFTGALEAAAQSANCRALIFIDAINEGNGRNLWPDNLSAFLAHLERSPWVAVVLAVRSSYEEVIIPDDVRKRATLVTHHGFADHEYDAVKTFFLHYGIELPSTPLIAPEFHNPLFLKTLCLGLQDSGKHQLPRGFSGISFVFDLYLTAINRKLAKVLDFDHGRPLVKQALSLLAQSLIGTDKRWMNAEKAAEIANTLLPNRSFSQSLYHGLVAEGLLITDLISDGRSAQQEEVVFIAYDRLADHIIAKALLDNYIEPEFAKRAFASDGPFAFLWDKSRYTPPGLLEALCIQLPERTRAELPLMATALMQQHALGDAFRESIVWRDPQAFTANTKVAFNKLIRSDHEFSNALDTLLTVATIPGHPLNAQYLNKLLRRHSMADRDSWWSTYLHRAFGGHSSVDRIIDWAHEVKPERRMEDDTVDLCSIVLTWMQTSSNRFLRDRATKALISLLTGRLQASTRLLEMFADVDDLYVKERLYAVCYGVAMRNSDVNGISALAQVVYSKVFANKSPVAHILLRDYARGVIERAAALNSKMGIPLDKVRPPYKSTFPVIPSAKDVRKYLPDWSSGSHDSGELQWSRNRIGSSIMSDDFARYVIGTNSSRTNWIALSLNSKKWVPASESLSRLMSSFSPNEVSAWKRFENADRELSMLRFMMRIEARPETGHESNGVRKSQTKEKRDHVLERTSKLRDSSWKKLRSILTASHFRQLKRILERKNKIGDEPPRFDLRKIQRYILWRVFDLGWTIERFGRFDRFSAAYYGREASKAERVGKKYQWIAFHEILAFIADHYQYREAYREHWGDKEYQGPWQDYLRDIDPSSTLRGTPGGTSWNGHSLSWWGTTEYHSWGDPNDADRWATEHRDLPEFQELLTVTRPSDGSKWVNLDGYFNWRQEPPADKESSDVERRDLWLTCEGYLVHREDIEAFLKWAEGVDFWNRWMPDAPEAYRLFLGEYLWSPAFRYFSQPYYGDAGWTQPTQGCPVTVRSTAFKYLQESSGFDCSVDDSFSLRLPVADIVDALSLRWSGKNADFLDAQGTLAAFDPTAYEPGPSALLLRKDLLRDLKDKGLGICWTVLGEKRVIDPGYGPPKGRRELRMSGAYAIDDGDPYGFLKCITQFGGSEMKVITTKRAQAHHPRI
ncbi:MAG: AVAST type 2 anti-phage system protein Avs2 [Terriglobales bacterium]